MTNRLAELFQMQKELNQKIGLPDFLGSPLSDDDKKTWVLHMVRAMQQELAELTDSVPWKWWAKYQKYDEQNARVEAVDLLHFLISLFMILGMGPEDVVALYQQKHAVNMKRQDTGYAVKDEQDCRHIDLNKDRP
jgi:dimeric dUTPase (all-alpha-NTP-PPase superfamily)